MEDVIGASVGVGSVTMTALLLVIFLSGGRKLLLLGVVALIVLAASRRRPEGGTGPEPEDPTDPPTNSRQR